MGCRWMWGLRSSTIYLPTTIATTINHLCTTSTTTPTTTTTTRNTIPLHLWVNYCCLLLLCCSLSSKNKKRNKKLNENKKWWKFYLSLSLSSPVSFPICISLCKNCSPTIINSIHLTGAWNFQIRKSDFSRILFEKNMYFS